MDDLHAAISEAELAVSITPEDHPDRVSRLSALEIMLSDRYSRTGNMDDLQAAISKAELAVSALPKDHPSRAERIKSLGMMLSDRYKRIGDMDDLQAAISNVELAISISPENHSYQGRWLDSLGIMLSDQYLRTGNIDDLQAAISKAELALSATPENHPNRAAQLSNLGVKLEYLYDRTGNMGDTQAAISKAELAISATPEDYPEQARLLNNLANLLSDRYNRTGNMDDLQAAILKADLAVSATPEGHPERARWLYNLGFKLSNRYKRTGNIDDLQKTLRSFIDSFDLPSAIPLIRVRAARNALRILVALKKWDQASSLAQAAIKLLPNVCDRYLSREDQQYAILQISGLASDACSLSLKMGHVHQGLQQLEFGRGVIFGYLVDGRTDLSKLQHNHPHLANAYEAVRYKAYTDVEEKDPLIRAQLVRERRDAATRLQDCLNRIRLERGYEGFLLEPIVDELQQTASEGPIVIVNATDIGCDAIIVSTSKIQAIALPEMNFSQAPSFFQQKLGRYRSIDHEQCRNHKRDLEYDTGGVGSDEMSCLWFSCVKPILEELKDIQESDSHELPRIWWIGTGIASSFPFHAAGQYNK